MPPELLIRAGRVFCAAAGLDGPGAVAVRDGRIVSAGPEPFIPGSGIRRVIGSGVRQLPCRTAGETLDFPDCLLLPGLVDLHAHPDSTAPGGSKFGVDPDRHMLPRGVTTVLSQGDAGPLNWERYRREVIEASQTRVLLALNLAGHGEASPGGCFADPAGADPEACVRAIHRARSEAAGGRSGIWGISVNTSAASCGGTDPREVMRRALAAAEECGCPLLVGTRRDPDWSLDEQLPLLRPGDVVTYCFHSRPEGLLRDGKIRECVRAARVRGVLFDVGHGMESFSPEVARAALDDGFPPDTISTDLYRRHLERRPPHDLPRVLSRLLAAGMPEREAFAAVTVRPAAVLGLSGEIGTLVPGSCADLTVLRWNEGGAGAGELGPPLHPSTTPSLHPSLPSPPDAGHGCWEPVAVIRGGAVIVPAGRPAPS